MSTLFESVKHKKAPHRIFNQIRSLILSGQLSLGDKLPSEHELTNHFGVSRQTLREALRALEAQGLLEIRAGLGGGAFVSQVDMGMANASLNNFLYSANPSIKHISEIRKALEPLSARLAAERITDEQLGGILELQDQSKVLFDQNRYGEIVLLGVDFHCAVSRGTGNLLLALILDLVEKTLIRAKQPLGIDRKFSQAMLDSHEEIIAALTARNPEMAEQAMRQDMVLIEQDLMRLAMKKGKSNDWLNELRMQSIYHSDDL